MKMRTELTCNSNHPPLRLDPPILAVPRRAGPLSPRCDDRRRVLLGLVLGLGACAFLGSTAGVANADLVISTDTTFNGTTVTVDPPAGLFVTHASNDPLLTMTNNADSAGVEAVVVGSLTGESGRLLIDGGSTLDNSGTLALGIYGSVLVLRGDANLGLNAGSTGTATVTGVGSTWTNSRNLLLGNAGTGTLNVEAGGSVTSSTGFIGVAANSTGTATVTGVGSTWSNSLGLSVGNFGTGTLNIEAGGSVSSNLNNSVIGNNGTGTVTVTGVGSAWNNSAGLNLGNNGTGTLNIGPGGLVEVGSNFSIGNNPANTLAFILAGTGVDDVGLLDVANDMALGSSGTFQILLDNFNPALGDTFNLFDFGGSLTGTFATLDLPTLNPGLSWDTGDLYTQGVVSVIPEPASLALLGVGGLLTLRRRARDA